MIFIANRGRETDNEKRIAHFEKRRSFPRSFADSLGTTRRSCFARYRSPILHTHVGHGQLRFEAALRNREEDRRAEAVAAKAGRVPAESTCLSAIAAHPGSIREQVRQPAERDR